MYKEIPGKLCSIFQVFRMNLEKLSKPELLTLFSILEGELEARDLVIEALKVCCKYHDKRRKWQQYYYRFCKALAAEVKFRGKDLLLVQNPILISAVLDNKCCISFCVLVFIIESWLQEAFRCWNAALCVCFHPFWYRTESFCDHEKRKRCIRLPLLVLFCFSKEGFLKQKLSSPGGITD